MVHWESKSRPFIFIPATAPGQYLYLRGFIFLKGLDMCGYAGYPPDIRIRKV